MGSKGPNAHLTFAYLCKFLESSSQPSRRKGDKIIAFQIYLRKFEDPYTLLRLMCPGIDYARANYGLKENELAKLFSNVLALPETQKERLVQYKNAAKQSGHGCVAGDFMSVLYSVLEHRVGTKASNLTLDEVDRRLDELTKGDQRTPMLEMVRVMSSLELKWLARIILKDMKLGFDHKSVIRSLHRDALDLFNASSDLKQVLDEIKKLGTSRKEDAPALDPHPSEPAPAKGSENPDKNASSEPAPAPAPQDLLFQKLKPMLARRLPLNRERIIEGRTFLVETKLDGERMIAHICRDTNTVKLFTRNCIEYTSQYSQILDPIKKALRGKQAILDGEIVAYCSLEHKILPFGTNRAVAASKDGESVNLVYYIFDVLYYKSDGEAKNLCGTALELRKNFLQQIIVDSKTVKVVEHEGPFSELSKMESLLLRAIDNKEEGIMVKDVKSIYRFHRRNAGWFKMKPEHSGLTEHLDLLVFGAYFADTSRRRNTGSDHVADQCSVFLVGALDPDTGAVVSVARVGTGYDFAQLADIRNMLRPHLKKYDAQKRPPWCQYKFSTRNTPDAIIDDPKHGFIMEVRASEITDSLEFEFGHTLRFPTAHIPIRRDKDWNDAMTVEQLRELTTESRQLAQQAKRDRIQEGGASGGESGTDQEMPSAKRRRGGSATSSGTNRVIARFQPTDTSLVKSGSALFAGKEIFVLNGDEKYCIQEIEKFIVMHGGGCVKNRRPATDFVVAAKMDLRAKNTARLQVDILRYQYLFDCEDAKEIIAMKPWHMLATSDKTRREVLADYDRFGDHYRDPISRQMFLTIAPPQDELQGVSDHLVELAHALVAAKMGLWAKHTARCEDAKEIIAVKMEDAKEIRRDATMDQPVLETEDAKEIIPAKPEVFEDTTRREDVFGDYDRFGDHYRDPISTQMFLTITPSQDDLQGVSEHLMELAHALLKQKMAVDTS